MTAAPARGRSDLEDLTSSPRTASTRAVDGVSFDVGPGETLGIVGESGCGKSVTALSILRLLPPRIGRTVGGSRRASRAATCSALDEATMRAIRGNRIAMIFQEPMTSLNPVLTVGHQIAEAVRIHQGASAAREARERARRDAASSCASPTPSGGSTTIRTSSPAACASG